MFPFLTDTIPITAPKVPLSGEALMPKRAESFGEGLWELLSQAIGTLNPSLAEAASVCLSLIAVVLLISIVQQLPGSRKQTAELAGAAAICLILLQSAGALVNLGMETIRELSGYGKLLMAVMASAMAAQGGVTASTALYAGTAVFSTVLTSLLTGLLVPMVNLYLAMAAAQSALGEQMLKKLCDLIKWGCTWVLKTVLYVFTGYIGITGVVSGATDAAALKVAKLTISGMVPVVGGILSDASEAVLVSAGVVRNAAGIYGILALLAVVAGPFLRIGVHYLLLKATGAVSELFGAKRCSQLISDASGAMGLLLAMTGSVCLLLLISMVCFLRGVE